MKFFLFLFLVFRCFCFADEGSSTLFHECDGIPKDIALVQLSFDGINTFHCGVGQVLLQSREVFKKINNLYRDKLHIKLYFLSGNYSNLLPEYSTNVLYQNQIDCEESGGEVCLLPITKNNQMFGDPEQWEELCNAGALECVKIINKNIFTIIIAHDSAYAQLPIKIRDLTLKGMISKPFQIIWIPHATSWAYNGHTSNGIAKWPQRHEWELESIRQAEMSRYWIGYVSDTIKKDILGHPFNLPEKCLIPYRIGILLDPYLSSTANDRISLELKKRNIPLDKRLIFSIGRATPLKGLDITLEMYRHLKNSFSDIHLVMLAPISDYMPSYLQILKDRVEKEKLDVTLIDYFDADLAHYIYQWQNTVMVSLLSRMDTSPLTVMEARVNPKNCVVLTSDSARMGNQVLDNVDGFTCSLDGLDQIIEQPLPCTGAIERIVERARQILELPTDRRKMIVESAKDLISERYDISKNIYSNFENILKKYRENIIRIKQNIQAPLDFDMLLELITHSEKIKKFYSLSGTLFFQPLQGGTANPPIMVYNKTEEGIVPLGLLKLERGDIQVASQRLKLLSELKSSSFQNLPTIFQDISKRYLVDIGDHFYYFIEFLKDANHINSINILEILGQFHQKVQSAPIPELLRISKLEEYKERHSYFSDPFLKANKSEIFDNPIWKKITDLSNFFNSEEFESIYKKLPSQIIHGDFNQTNFLISNNLPYIIDLDALRYDVRLLDLTSYFRYGGFDLYLQLAKEGNLINTINKLYGKTAGELNLIEENTVHLMVCFSNIEFISWVLKSLKYEILNGNKQRENEYINYINEYTEKTNQLLPFILPSIINLGD